MAYAQRLYKPRLYYKTFLEMGKLYEDAGGNDIYHSKLLPEITALEIKYSKDDIIDKI